MLVSDIDSDLDRISDAQEQIYRAMKISMYIGYLTSLNKKSFNACNKQDIYEKIVEETATYSHESNIAHKIVAELLEKKVK